MKDSADNKKEAVKTEVPGTIGAAAKQPADQNDGQTGTVDLNGAKGETKDDTAPDWVAQILQSNEAVIASNEQLIESIGLFRESATDLVKQIVVTGKLYTDPAEETSTEPVKTGDGTKYVVSAGKQFQDKHTHHYYNEGDDVSHLADDRLQRLLSQKIIERA